MRNLLLRRALCLHFLPRFKLYSEFGEAEFRHCFLPRAGVVDTFVVPHPETGEITDMCSFYHLPSSIIGHKQHNKLNAAYSFYNVATSVSLLALMQDCLTLARQRDFDVFNALNIMDNEEFLKDLKFGIGDGHLQVRVNE
jgi:glycylpeptide N-tetradecanoyltransferase